MSYNTIAQIINQPDLRQSAGVNLYFSAVGGDVVASIATVDANGQAEAMLGEQRLLRANIKTDGGATQVIWEQPILLQPGNRYVLSIACADVITALQAAKVGEANAAGGLVTAAQAGVGTLMRINPSGVVTSYENTMLRFDMLAVQYTVQSKNVVIGTQAVVGATALLVNAGATQPEATARIRYTLDLIADGKTVHSFDVDAGQPVRIDAPFTGDVRVSATLGVGTNGLGAVLEPGTMLLVGTLKTDGTYISPAITSGGGTDLRVIYDGEIPAGAGVAVHVQADDASDWKAVPFDSSTNAAGVVEVSHRLQGLMGDAHRLRITVTGNTLARPKVRNLRAAILG